LLLNRFRPAVHRARAAFLRLTTELEIALGKIETAIQQRFTSVLEKWEEDAKRAEEERERQQVATRAIAEAAYLCEKEKRPISAEIFEGVVLRNGIRGKSANVEALETLETIGTPRKTEMIGTPRKTIVDKRMTARMSTMGGPRQSIIPGKTRKAAAQPKRHEGFHETMGVMINQMNGVEGLSVGTALADGERCTLGHAQLALDNAQPHR
jgi:hypothetical protein